jgi:hypothetical protein
MRVFRVLAGGGFFDAGDDPHLTDGLRFSGEQERKRYGKLNTRTGRGPNTSSTTR